MVARIGALATRRSTPMFIVLAIGASLVVIGLGLGLTFFSDEWAFIESRSLWDPGTWWAPHFEHWSTLAVVLYSAILEVVGLRSYLPFLAVLFALHLLGCAAAFVLVRRRVGPIVALGASLVGLLIGSGFENLFWGFQIGFVGSTAAGLWALVILDDPPTPARRAALCALLLVSLASSGIGLTSLVAAGSMVLLRAEWRASAWVVVIPGAAYGAWFVGIGWTGVGIHRPPLNLETVVAIPAFIGGGLANAAGAVLGVGPQLGVVAAAAIAVAAVWAGLRRRAHPPVLALACTGGLAIQYALIAAARAGVTEGQVDYTRYTYEGAFLAIVAIADIASTFTLPQGRAGRVAVACALVAALELSLAWNLRLLVEGRGLFAQRAMTTRALIIVALDPAYAGKARDDRSLILVPSPRSLRAIVDRYGSPLTDSLAPWAVPPVTPEAIADALRRAANAR